MITLKKLVDYYLWRPVSAMLILLSVIGCLWIVVAITLLLFENSGRGYEHTIYGLNKYLGRLEQRVNINNSRVVDDQKDLNFQLKFMVREMARMQDILDNREKK